MKRLIVLGATAIALTATLALAETKPDDVVFKDGVVAQSLTGKPGDPKEGLKVATTKSLGNCVACHAAKALEVAAPLGNIGPALDGAGTRWNEGQLRGIVAGAKHMFPDSVMPSFYKTSGFVRPGDDYTGKAAKPGFPPILSAQQVEDVVAFLQTLKN